MTKTFHHHHSLELRRLHFGSVYCYKIIFSLTGIHCSDLFELMSESGTRGQPYKISKHCCKCTVLPYAHFFQARCQHSKHFTQSIKF